MGMDIDIHGRFPKAEALVLSRNDNKDRRMGPRGSRSHYFRMRVRRKNAVWKKEETTEDSDT